MFVWVTAEKEQRKAVLLNSFNSEFSVREAWISVGFFFKANRLRLCWILETSPASWTCLLSLQKTLAPVQLLIGGRGMFGHCVTTRQIEISK